MELEEALQAYVVADESISAVIASRMYPVFAPESAASPYLVYRVLSTQREYTMSGPTGTAQPTIKITCWADTYPAAKALARLVRSRLDGYRGTMGGISVRRIFLNDESDAFEPSPELLQRQMFGRELDFEIEHHEG